jgi:hypothetical protein
MPNKSLIEYGEAVVSSSPNSFTTANRLRSLQHVKNLHRNQWPDATLRG